MSSPCRTESILSFFERLAEIERVARIALSDEPLSALISIRGPNPARLLLDFSSEPARIERVDRDIPANLHVAIQAEALHRVLLGELHPGEALGRRELLVRGSASDVAKITPLFDIAPLLYREHLSELDMTANHQPRFRGDPIPLVELSSRERALHATIERMAYGAGYALAVLRTRYLRHMSLFDVLRAMGRGVEDAGGRP